MKSNLVRNIQDAMHDLENVDIETSHTFCDGVYSREIKIPAGVCLVGAKHKTRFFMVLSQGECVIVDNGIREELKAPCTLISPIGAKRAIYAITDTVLTTFHKTKETDVSKIEHEIIESEGDLIANNPKELIE